MSRRAAPRRAPGSVLLAGLVLLLCPGCFEVEDLWTLNPDGSGKLTRTVILAPRGRTAEEWARFGLERAQGVEAWADFGAQTREDGRLQLTGTAYFRDANALQLKLGPQPYLVGGPDARRVVVSDSAPRELADEAQRQQRVKFAHNRLRLYAPAEQASFALQLELPGSPTPAAGLRAAEGRLSASVSAARVFAAARERIEGAEFLREGLGLLLPPEVARAVCGGPLEATLAGELRPRFDYAAEVARAKAQQDDLLDSLGVDAVAAGRPLRLRELRPLRLAYVHQERQLPSHLAGGLDEFQPHLLLDLGARLNGDVLAIDGVELREARALGGEDLLRPELLTAAAGELSGQPRREVRLTLALAAPQRPWKGLERVAGRLHLALATRRERYDLGFENLHSGARNERARVDELHERWLSLSVYGLAEGDVAEVSLVAAGGEALEVLTFEQRPERGRLELQVFTSRPVAENEAVRVVLQRYVDRRQVALPFEFGPLDPTGRPPR